MIGSIKGKVAYLANEYCLLETNSGVGYRVFMPAAHLGQLAVGMEARVHTYMAVREDAILLFGFLNQEYYNLFLLLLGVSGVGPKVALGILSAVKPDDFYLAVQSRDLKVLTKLPGIGKKTAERLLLELKDKVGGIGGDSDSGFADTAFGGGSAAVDEAIEALCALGYSNSEIMPALKQIPNYAELSSEVIIKQALKLFAWEEIMQPEERIITGQEQDADVWQYSLRPRRLAEYIGQNQVKHNMEVFIKAAADRKEALDHVLLFGPPGLGKTTLANIIANELNVNIRVTSGPAIERQGDLAAILTNLGDNDVLFIDEIHRLSKTVEEILYSAMEDYALDIIIGKGPSARSVRLDLPKFTLIGATTRLGAIAAPLRDRFGVQCRLEFYKPDELQFIITRAAEILGVEIAVTEQRKLHAQSRNSSV